MTSSVSVLVAAGCSATGAVLILAGKNHVVDPAPLAGSIDALSSRLRSVAARSLGAAEVALGAGLIVVVILGAEAARPVIAAVGLLLITFTIWLLHQRGDDSDGQCACTGSLQQINWATVARPALMCVPLVLAFIDISTLGAFRELPAGTQGVAWLAAVAIAVQLWFVPEAVASRLNIPVTTSKLRESP